MLNLASFVYKRFPFYWGGWGDEIISQPSLSALGYTLRERMHNIGFILAIIFFKSFHICGKGTSGTMDIVSLIIHA